jgi:hypothetical protein
MAAMNRSIFAVASFAMIALTSGCATLIVKAPTMLGRDTAPHYPFRTARAHVDAQLGPPSDTTRLPDGGHVAAYKYRARNREPNAVGKVVMEIELLALRSGAGMGQAAGYGFLGLEVLLIPIATGAAIYAVATPSQGTVTFTYSPYGELLHYGAPPSYGPGDHALGQPAIGALRTSCWSNGERDERQYVECVSRGLAVWGILE